MKSTFIFIFLLFQFYSQAQNPGEWMWVSGDSTSSIGVYGTQGISSPTNVPPSLYEACEWKDLSGNFWLFGGLNNTNMYNDLWKYDPSLNEWTWMKGPGIPYDTGSYGIQGISAPSNNPPSRSYGALSWVDLNGNFWMFGGAKSVAFFGDLWKYDLSTNEWTWMHGPNVVNQFGVYGTQGIPSILNTPGARAEVATSWTDSSGDLWLFGGNSINGNYFNDLWRYNIASNCWTWMKGSQTPNQSGSYGVKGIETGTNNPHARNAYCKWKDNNGNFWFMGGGNATYGMSNDMWRFNPNTNNWTWMKGDNWAYPGGVNGIMCQPADTNIPFHSYENRASWVDVNGNFWAFTVGQFIQNPLWMYCFVTNQWAIVSGNQAQYQGHWGIKGVSSPMNMPPISSGPISWLGDNGRLYMFGGGNGTWFNTLWCYASNPCCSACPHTLANFGANTSTICPGTCADFFYSGCDANLYLWSFPGATPSTSTDANPQNICYPTPGSYDVQLIATNAQASDTLLLTNYITVYPSPPPQSITQNGDTLFAISGSGIYQWYLNGNIINGATNYFYVATQSGDYNVVATDSNDCEVEAAIFNVIANAYSLSQQNLITVFPIPGSEKLFINFSMNIVSLKILDLFGRELFTASVFQDKAEIDIRFLSTGIYFLQVQIEKGSVVKKFIKE